MAKVKHAKLTQASTAFSVRMPDKIIGKLRALAAKQDMTINAYINGVIGNHINVCELNGGKIRAKAKAPAKVATAVKVKAAKQAKKANGVVPIEQKRRGRPRKEILTTPLVM